LQKTFVVAFLPLAAGFSAQSRAGKCYLPRRGVGDLIREGFMEIPERGVSIRREGGPARSSIALTIMIT
jgi:hypothetical protein